MKQICDDDEYDETLVICLPLHSKAKRSRMFRMKAEASSPIKYDYDHVTKTRALQLRRPNLCWLFERLVLARLRPHLTNSKNFSKRQSAYRQGHSTETALLDVLDSVHTEADSKEVTLYIGLDLSSLNTEFGVSGTALSWIQSYLYRTGHSL